MRITTLFSLVFAATAIGLPVAAQQPNPGQNLQSEAEVRKPRIRALRAMSEIRKSRALRLIRLASRMPPPRAQVRQRRPAPRILVPASADQPATRMDLLHKRAQWVQASKISRCRSKIPRTSRAYRVARAVPVPNNRPARTTPRSVAGDDGCRLESRDVVAPARSQVAEADEQCAPRYISWFANGEAEVVCLRRCGDLRRAGRNPACARSRQSCRRRVLHPSGEHETSGRRFFALEF